MVLLREPHDELDENVHVNVAQQYFELALNPLGDAHALSRIVAEHGHVVVAVA